MRHRKLWITLALLLLAALVLFFIYRLHCFTCASGGTFSYGAPGGMGG